MTTEPDLLTKILQKAVKVHRIASATDAERVQMGTDPRYAALVAEWDKRTAELEKGLEAARARARAGGELL